MGGLSSQHLKNTIPGGYCYYFTYYLFPLLCLSLALDDHVPFTGRLKEDGKSTDRDSISEILAGLRQEKFKKWYFP